MYRNAAPHANLLRGEIAFDNTGIVNKDDPASFLRSPPTPEEHALAEHVGLHDGASIPFHMFAKVAVRQGRQAEWIGEMEAMRKWVRRRATAALLALAGNLTLFGGYVLHRVREGGAAEERALNQERAAIERREAMEREINELRLDVRELRAAMRRLGLGPDPAGSGTDIDILMGRVPDKVSLLKGPSCTIFASSPP